MTLVNIYTPFTHHRDHCSKNMTFSPSYSDPPLSGEAKTEAWRTVCRWMESRERVTAPQALFTTGLADIDGAFGGGIPGGTLCELIAPRSSCGAQTALRHLLQVARSRRLYAALVDLGSGFDPGSVPESSLESLLWLQCKTVKAALQAADVIVRDDNISLLLLDLCAAGRNTSHGIARTAWYRLQRALEKAGAVTILFARQPVSPASRLRWEVTAGWQIDNLDVMPAAEDFLNGRLIPSIPVEAVGLSAAG